MPQYETFEPNVEVIGANLRSFIENTHYEDILPVLKQHNLENVDPEQWYPMQPWLDVLSDIATGGGAMFDLVSIGMAISETALLPPEATSMPLTDFMMNLNAIYQMQHRGGDAGSIEVSIPEPQHIVLEAVVPYPDDLEYGTAYGFAKRFLPARTPFIVRYDDDIPRREQGGDVTVIHIEW